MKKAQILIYPELVTSTSCDLVPLTLFYKPQKRDEDSLSHWFLAVLERIETDTLVTLFEELKLPFAQGIGHNLKIKSQEDIGEKTGDEIRIIDGLIEADEIVIGFENKVKSRHESVRKKRGQLSTYYRLLDIRHDKPIRLLITADQDKQSRKAIESVIDEQDLNEKYVVSRFWQQIHGALIKVSEKYSHRPKDYLLLTELATTLEEMNMGSFLGIELEDLEQYIQTKKQLERLNVILRRILPNRIEQLENAYNEGENRGSILNKSLRFKVGPFSKKAVWFYVYLNRKEKQLTIGLTIRKDTKTKIDSRKSLLNELEDTCEQIKRMYIDVGKNNEIKSPDEIRDCFSDSGIAEKTIRFYSVYEFNDLVEMFAMDEPQFPDRILNECMKFRDLIHTTAQLALE